MGRICLIVLFVFVPFIQGLSQQYRIGLETGIGQYEMKDLKDLNYHTITALPFSAEQVSNFPAYFYFEPVLVFRKGKMGIGLLYSRYSSGSRISAKDYSGEYRFDQKINSNSFGLSADYDVWSQGNSNLSTGATFRIMPSNLEITDYFQIIDTVLTDQTSKYKSLNYSLEPGLTFSHTLGLFTLAVNTGYLFCFSAQTFKSLDFNNEPLRDPQTDKKLKPDWNGFRIGISLFVTFYNSPRLGL